MKFVFISFVVTSYYKGGGQNIRIWMFLAGESGLLAPSHLTIAQGNHAGPGIEPKPPTFEA